MKHTDGKGNYWWDADSFIIPEYDTPEYWKHFRQSLKDMHCLTPPLETRKDNG